MGASVRDDVGGILSLADFVDDHRDAVAYHLITLGLRLRWLGSSRLSWEDLRVIITAAPPGSPLHWDLDPERAAWNSGAVNAYLLALVVDVINAGNWQRARKRTAPKPKPVPRPGDSNKGAVFGSEPVPVSQFDEWWNTPDSEED